MDLTPNKKYAGFYAVYGKTEIFLITNKRNITQQIVIRIINHLCDIRHITSDCRKSIIDTLKSSVNEYKSIKQEICPAVMTLVDRAGYHWIRVEGNSFQVNTSFDDESLPYVFTLED